MMVVAYNYSIVANYFMYDNSDTSLLEEVLTDGGDLGVKVCL